MTSNRESATRLRMAIQKSGRLTEKTLQVLEKCGLEFEFRKDQLLAECRNFPIDLMLVRDDDIPEYLSDGVCELGVVGLNVLEERQKPNIEKLRPLGYGRCRLSIAVPKDSDSFIGGSPKKIATSYPNLLRTYLQKKGATSEIIELSGSVEIAPTLKIADAICDLVSSGATLKMNGLVERETILESEAWWVRSTKKLSDDQASALARLTQRIDGVLKAAQSKYIMMNAPKSALPIIQKILPGMEEPSIMPLGIDGSKIAIHAVAREAIFWETLEQLKSVGASSILVLPIEKIVS